MEFKEKQKSLTNGEHLLLRFHTEYSESKAFIAFGLAVLLFSSNFGSEGLDLLTASCCYKLFQPLLHFTFVDASIHLSTLLPVISKTLKIRVNRRVNLVYGKLVILCLKDSGVLYENPYIQISIKAQNRNDQGHLLLILENKNARVPLDSIQAVILPPSHLKLELSSVPEAIPPNSQHQCEFEVVNLCPGGDAAVLDFSYKFQTYLYTTKSFSTKADVKPRGSNAVESSNKRKITYIANGTLPKRTRNSTLNKLKE
ncbi:hypothetical protein LXL04_033898 [Taraxacum kok-saghyz]